MICILDPYHGAAMAVLQSELGVELVFSNIRERRNGGTLPTESLVQTETRIIVKNLKAVSRLQVVKQGVGVDNIDLDAAYDRGVAVYNTPSLKLEAVAELTLALALFLSRRVTELDRRTRSCEQVVRSNALGHELVAVNSRGRRHEQRWARRCMEKWIGACETTIVGYDPAAPAVGIWILAGHSPQPPVIHKAIY
ncbi:hypothetical protein JDV02_002782 [Purpureocillium takamizusanense]|uniref:D-isomer specific 2-hydroxyacid dehydrogenase catalytic domain-containing protein n=1 Tax=Purpureocillium takamizusanense TaxID=2060973 RepID=A0A9Q8Q9D5_9HYPO|nr:uncharacterized protein JDV02_002782 [Purpureocillium takamizusanense]UNI16344.1 hypothetical protein JDV02_002782 [Purpureocillium takamizusanense]